MPVPAKKGCKLGFSDKNVKKRGLLGRVLGPARAPLGGLDLLGMPAIVALDEADKLPVVQLLVKPLPCRIFQHLLSLHALPGRYDLIILNGVQARSLLLILTHRAGRIRRKGLLSLRFFGLLAPSFARRGPR